MEKLPMCRICLVENVRMYAVVEKTIQDMYESLTHFSFITEDSRPTLACVFCYAKLKQCCLLQRQSLQAEQLFAQMINEAYPSINQDQSKVFNAFVKTEVVNISIDGVVQMEHVAIKEEVPVYYDGPEDIIEPKEEPHSDGNSNDCSDVEETPVQHSESKKNMMEIKREVKQEHGGSEEERKASDMRWASAAENPQEDIKNIKVEDVNTEEQTKVDKSDTKSIQEIQNHMPKVKLKGPHKCEYCQISFVCKSHLVRHLYTHTGEKPYKCNICQRSFNRQSYLTVHIRQHTGERPYRCDTCQSGYSNKGDLLRHIRTHTGERLYKCEICQRYFSKKNHLIIHIRTHTGEKPYKCNTCQYECKSRSDLLKHMPTHTGEKPFKCDVCQRAFGRKTHLTLHVRMHTGDKPYRCDTCPYGCNSRADLLKHVRKHTGEKPFKCDVCHRSFARKNTFTRHLQTHPGEKPCQLEKCLAKLQC